MYRWKLKVCTAAALMAMAGSMAFPVTAEASSSTLRRILFGAVGGLAISQIIGKYYMKQDDEGQAHFLSSAQKETGVYESAEADNRVQSIYQSIKDTGAVGRDYTVYVAPDEDINAFMSLGGVLCVDKGALDAMDDDELAYIMGHEISHGEKRHSVNGAKKQAALIVGSNIALYNSDVSYLDTLLANVAANYVSNAVFTKDQEKEADNWGFQYLVEAGYNPGAGAASMEVIKEKYGDLAPAGLKGVIAPSNHPATSDRINKNLKWMSAYADNHVKVKDDWIQVNGVKAFQPAASGKYSQKERTYLTAGKLAKLYHAGHVPDAVLQDNVITVGHTEVYELSGGEDGKVYLDALNKGIRKDRGDPVDSHFAIDDHRKDIQEKAEQGDKEK